jgi:hypothetical protein
MIPVAGRSRSAASSPTLGRSFTIRQVSRRYYKWLEQKDDLLAGRTPRANKDGFGRTGVRSCHTRKASHSNSLQVAFRSHYDTPHQSREVVPMSNSEQPQVPQFCCPSCGSKQPPISGSKVTATGWVLFVVLLLVCFPLFWIGLLIKDEYYDCSQCGRRFVDPKQFDRSRLDDMMSPRPS